MDGAGGHSSKTRLSDFSKAKWQSRLARNFWGSRHFTQWLISESSALRVTDSYTLTRQVPLLKHHSRRFDLISTVNVIIVALHMGVHFSLQYYITEHQLFTGKGDAFNPSLTASCQKWGAWQKQTVAARGRNKPITRPGLYGSGAPCDITKSR